MIKSIFNNDNKSFNVSKIPNMLDPRFQRGMFWNIKQKTQRNAIVNSEFDRLYSYLLSQEQTELIFAKLTVISILCTPEVVITSLLDVLEPIVIKQELRVSDFHYFALLKYFENRLNESHKSRIQDFIGMIRCERKKLYKFFLLSIVVPRVLDATKDRDMNLTNQI
jgi:hypothetical protein